MEGIHWKKKSWVNQLEEPAASLKLLRQVGGSCAGLRGPQASCNVDWTPGDAQVEKVQMVDNPDQSSIWFVGHDRESFHQFIKAFTDAW